MTTKKQKHAAGIAKREVFMAQVKAEGLAALKKAHIHELETLFGEMEAGKLINYNRLNLLMKANPLLKTDIKVKDSETVRTDLSGSSTKYVRAEKKAKPQKKIKAQKTKTREPSPLEKAIKADLERWIDEENDEWFERNAEQSSSV